MRIPRQPLEALVAGLGEPEVIAGEVVQLQAFHARLQAEYRDQPAALVDDRQAAIIQRLHRFRIGEAGQCDAPQYDTGRGELDQLRMFAGNGEQRAGQRVPGQPGGFVFLEPGQRGLQRQLIVRQPDASGTLFGSDRALAPVQPQLVIPMQQPTGDEQRNEQQQQDDSDEQAPTGITNGHEKRSSGGCRITTRERFAKKRQTRRVNPAASMDQSTRLSNRDRPTSSSTSSSPWLSGPTPAGVPVSTTSPGCRLKCPAMCCSSGRMALSI